MSKTATKKATATEATDASADHAAQLDRCKCQHLRRDHAGKTAKKRCTCKALGMPDGKCDCLEFREYVEPVQS